MVKFGVKTAIQSYLRMLYYTNSDRIKFAFSEIIGEKSMLQDL